MCVILLKSIGISYRVSIIKISVIIPILGNDTYYNLGYAEGYTKATDGKTIIYNYHQHIDADGNVITETSNSISGGCYTTGRHVHNSNCPTHTAGGYYYETCPGYMTRAQSHPYCTGGYDAARICYYCSVCGGHGGAGANGQKCSGKVKKGTEPYLVYDCGSPANIWDLGCGKTTGTIESITIRYD